MRKELDRLHQLVGMFEGEPTHITPNSSWDAKFELAYEEARSLGGIRVEFQPSYLFSSEADWQSLFSHHVQVTFQKEYGPGDKISKIAEPVLVETPMYLDGPPEVSTFGSIIIPLVIPTLEHFDQYPEVSLWPRDQRPTFSIVS